MKTFYIIIIHCSRRLFLRGLECFILSPVERGVEPEVAAVDPAGAAVEEKGAAVERSSNSGNRTGARFKVSGASGCGGRATSDPPSSRVMTHLACGSV